MFRLIPRRGNEPIAKTLIARFGTLGDVIGALLPLLQGGAGEPVALDLKLATSVSQHMLKSEIRNKQVPNSWSSVIDYCHAAMAPCCHGPMLPWPIETRERFLILFLDKRNVLIANAVQSLETMNHIRNYPREMVRCTLELSSTTLILIDTHPSGDSTPSYTDIKMITTIIHTTKAAQNRGS